MKRLERNCAYVLLTAGLLALAVVANFLSLPTEDSKLGRFDTLIVLGSPANLDGSASPEERSRVLEAIREYRKGIAPHIIMTGGAAHNQYAEAHVMAQFAKAQGIPASAIIEETQAQNTIQNIFYSAMLMHEHGWNSAEVVSSPNHLGRTSLILQTFDRRQPTLEIHWRTHAAPLPKDYPAMHTILLYSVEATRCLQLRITGFASSRFLPAN